MEYQPKIRKEVKKMAEKCNMKNHYKCGGKIVLAPGQTPSMSVPFECSKCGTVYNLSQSNKKCDTEICGTCGYAWFPGGPCRCHR